MSSPLKDFSLNDQTVIHFCFHRFESAMFGHYRLSQETDDQTKVFAVVGKKKDEVRTSAGHVWIIETGGRRSDNGLVSQWWWCVRREPFFFFFPVIAVFRKTWSKEKLKYFFSVCIFFFFFECGSGNLSLNYLHWRKERKKNYPGLNSIKQETKKISLFLYRSTC